MRLEFHLVKRSVDPPGVLGKAMLLISAIETRPCTLAELVAETGFSRATTHRLASDLEDHGMLRRDSAGRFALGGRLLALGRSAASGFGLPDLAEPHLRTLRDRTGESVQLYVQEGTQRRCLVALDSTHELRTIVAPGAQLPLGKGSAGRILSGAPVGPNGWLETLEEREAGVGSVSAPVITTDGVVVAAISVSGPIDRLGDSPGERFGSLVVKAANSLAASIPAGKY